MGINILLYWRPHEPLWKRFRNTNWVPLFWSTLLCGVVRHSFLRCAVSCQSKGLRVAEVCDLKVSSLSWPKFTRALLRLRTRVVKLPKLIFSVLQDSIIYVSRGLKFCWNKSQQWSRAAVELWLFRHSVNRCATLCPLSLQIKLFEKYFNRVCAVTLLNNVQMASLYCIALNYYVPVSHINPRKTLNFMNSPHSTHLHSASGFVLWMLVTLGKRSDCYTGSFILFSVITNIYNKKTKGPTLMELFTATE
jgi:hypothetical protein